MDNVTIPATKTIEFGKHRGKQFEDVPDAYLLWLWNTNEWLYKNKPEQLDDRIIIAMTYIDENLDAIKKNVKHKS